MRSVRVKITALALVGALALAGCARSTEDALRVGDVSVTTTQIDDTVSAFLTRLGENGTPGVDTVAGVRQFAVRATVFTEVARRYAQEQSVSVPEPDYEAVAQELQLSTDDPLVRIAAEARAYADALLADAQPRTPTEDEMRKVYDDFVALVGPDAATYEQVRAELIDWPQFGKALAVRDGLTEAAQRYGVTVNPLYQPLEFALLQTGQSGELTVVTLPLGEQGTGAVRSAG
jgi:hypothetical protein